MERPPDAIVHGRMCMGTGMGMGMGMSIGTGVGTGMFIRMGMGTGMSTGMGMMRPEYVLSFPGLSSAGFPHFTYVFSYGPDSVRASAPNRGPKGILKKNSNHR